MFKIVPFCEEHLLDFCDQPSHAGVLREWLGNGNAKRLEQTDTFSGLWGKKVLVCGGITPYWPGRGLLWCVFNEESKINFVPVFRGLRKWVREQPFSRIEVAVPLDFPIGHRRAELFGFELETPRARKYHIDGKDAAIYVLIKER